MTLDFTKTAHDCQVVKFLAPLVAQHFTYTDRRWTAVSDYTRPGEPAKWAVSRLICDLEEVLPPGKYWERTRRRLTKLQSIEDIRRTLQRLLQVRAAGLDCIQYRDTCPHPRRTLSS